MSDLDLYWMPILFLGIPISAAWVLALLEAARAGRRARKHAGSSHWQRARASFPLALVVVVGFLLLSIGPLWFQATFPRSLLRQAEIRLLGVAELGYGVAVLTAAVAVIPLATVLIRKPSPRLSHSLAARCLVLAASILVTAAAGEGIAAACLWADAIPMPWLPIRFADRSDQSVVDILVIGESSAQGVPYDRWFSVADIVAWKLREAFPQKTFQIENQATPGLSLQAMHTKLAGITRRPELVILYAGHNEFQSRFDWGHDALHYADQIPTAHLTLAKVARQISPFCRFMEAAARKLRISSPPPKVVTRRLVDVPVYTRAQYADRLREFRIRLGAIVSYLEWIGAQVVLVIPPGNDAGFEPNRSFLSSDTPRAEREAFAREFLAAQRDEKRNPEHAAKAYRRLLEKDTGFAECHFRLARLLEQSGDWDEAFRHYVVARDQDGLPMRLPSDFQRAYQEVAAGHPHAILIDGPAEFHSCADHGLIDDIFFADGLHPSLNGYVVLAQAILTKLRERQVFGWPAGIPLPRVTPLQCAQRFQIDNAKWQTICAYSEWFYERTAFVRHDPSERLAKAARYGEAARKLDAGAPVESIDVPGVGPRPEPLGRGPSVCTTR